MIFTFLKGAFLYPPLLKEWVNWLLECYVMFISLIFVGTVIYIVVRYMYLHIKKEGEIMKEIKEDTKVYYGFFRSM